MSCLRIPALFLLVFAGCSVEAQSPRSNEKSNVILITIDTLRADYVSAYGKSPVRTPALDALAAEGVLFETAYCQVPLTPPSHASILTGTYPATHGMRDFTSGPLQPGTKTLASILKSQGYTTAAFVSAFVLDSAWGLDQGFDLYYDDFDLEDFQGVNPGNVQRRAGETMSQIRSWLPGAREPFFLWVHLFDPHHNYDPPEPFKTRFASNPYAGEVAYVDSEIEKFISELRKGNLYDNSLIVATSDHGESLGDHQEQEHGFFLYDTTTRIPLIAKPPVRYRTKNKRVKTTAQTVDLVPTVLQILRISNDPKWGIEGKGLLAAILGKERAGRAAFSAGYAYAETLYPRTTFGWSDLQTYREGRYKYIDAPKAELYDLSQDPGETRNLYGANRALANQLQQKLRTLERGLGRTKFADVKGKPGGGLDAEKLERLGALGYVALGQAVPVKSDARLSDPKDKVLVFNRVLEALQAAEAGSHEKSNAILQGVSASNPDLFIVHYSIGTNYLRLGRLEEALSTFNRARELNPNFYLVDVGAAKALAALGRVSEGIQLLNQVVKTHPDHLPSQRQLALLLTRERRFDEAASVYQEILTRRPDDKQAIKFLGVALVEGRKYDEGLEVFSRAAQLGVDDAMTRNFSGIALANLGRAQEALASYRKALELKPDYDQARLNLSFTLLKAGQTAEARREFHLLCSSNPRLCRQFESHFR